MRDLGHIAAMIGVLAGASAHASGHGASWIFRFRTLFVGISRNAAYIRDSQTDRGLPGADGRRFAFIPEPGRARGARLLRTALRLGDAVEMGLKALIAGLSIKRKLTLVTMTTSTAALVVASVMFGVFDRVTSNQSTVKQLTTMADVIGGNSAAALTFDDASAGSEILFPPRPPDQRCQGGGLRCEGHVVHHLRPQSWTAAARLRNRDRGNSHGAVADHREADSAGAGPDRHDLPGIESSGGERARQAYAIIMLAAFAMSLLAAYALSASLQRLISGPIIHLAQTARSSRRPAPTHRARKSRQRTKRAAGRRFQRDAGADRSPGLTVAAGG
jgi:hypothetical protein